MSKKTMTIIGITLLVIGSIMVAWPGLQRLYSGIYQAMLLGNEAPPTIEVPLEVAEDPEIAEEDEPSVIEDQGPFVILIPKIDVKAAVVNGVELEDLAKGPGFYDGTPRPGSAGNVCIAGHRTTYGAWFRRVHELEEGDEIILESPQASHLYLVESVFPVAKNAWEVIDPTPEPKLTLTTCHPPGSASERLVVRAALETTTWKR